MKTLYTEQHRAPIALLIAERKRAGPRQQDLARQLGHRQQWVYNIEQGQCRVGFSDELGFDPGDALAEVAKLPGPGI